MSMMGKFTKIAALGMSACAMMALAQPASAAEDPAASEAKAAAAVNEKAVAKKAAAKKYCIRIALETGTRVPKEQCKTKAEWADDGIEVPAGR